MATEKHVSGKEVIELYKPDRSITDRMTSIDNNIYAIAKILIRILGVLEGKQVTTPTTPAPQIPDIEPLIRQLVEAIRELREVITNIQQPITSLTTVKTIPADMIRIAKTKYIVKPTEWEEHLLREKTDYVLITVFDDNIFFDVEPINNKSQLFPAGSVIEWYRNPKYNKIYLQSESKNARVYITEWSMRVKT